MKKVLAIVLCALLAALPALAEESTAPDGGDSLSVNPLGKVGEVTGDPDEPALKNPEERYEVYVEETDGSDQLIFGVFDAMNDEARDIAEHGALYITENQGIDASGTPALRLEMVLQDSPYGTVLISTMQLLWMKYSVYAVGTHSVTWDGSTAELGEGLSQDDYDFFIESYHFPYGPLQTLHGMRSDENGYGYFLIKSSDEMTFEFVIGDSARIVQLRVYERDEDGELALSSYVDYDVGPAQEIPQPVLDALGEVLQPTPAPTEVPGDYDESVENNPLIQAFKGLIGEDALEAQ